MTITDKNRVLAEFMGEETTKNSKQEFLCRHSKQIGKKLWLPIECLAYHKSLDWLWPVWCKFRDLKFKSLNTSHWKHCRAIIGRLSYGTIAEIHEALYNAIVWYNENK